MWRNGRRKRLKIIRETMWVRVPPSAFAKAQDCKVLGFLLSLWHSHAILFREEGNDGVGRCNFAGEIQVGVNVACGADIAVAEPLLNFLQADTVRIKQAGAAVAEIVKADAFHPMFD